MLARRDIGEKRQHERFTSEASIIYSVFSTKFLHGYASRTFNHGKGGICFESIHPLNPGTTLFIRSGKNPTFDLDNRKCEQLRTASLAEVRWCLELSDDLKTIYRVGVTYIYPYYP